LYSIEASFRTKTIDLSGGGVLLANSLPSHFQEIEFEMLFILESKNVRDKEYFMLNGRAVDARRIRVQFITASSVGRAALVNLIKKLDDKIDKTVQDVA
jgi:low temperature requirement protein LtrA